MIINGGSNVNINSRRTRPMWVNEKTELDIIYQNLEIVDGEVDAVVNEFCDMWYNDIDGVKDSDKGTLIQAANGILTWWNVELMVTDLTWAEEDNCFIWKVQ
jgi:hypothetical protein